MALRKISPISIFTIFLTLLLLSSRIYCQDSSEEDCDSSEEDNEPGSGPGPSPGNMPGPGPGKGPGSDPGKGPGSDPGKGPGSDPGKEPGSNPLSGLGSDPLSGLVSQLGLDNLESLADYLKGFLDPEFLKGVVGYAGDLVDMLKPALTAVDNALNQLVTDPISIAQDPKSFAENLVTGVIMPVTAVLKDVTTEAGADVGGLASVISGALPPELMTVLQGPIDGISNSLTDLALDVANIFGAIGNPKDAGSDVFQSLGDIGSSLTGLSDGLGSLLNIIPSSN